MKKLFEPKSVAIIGASETVGKVGNMLVHNVSTYGYTGKVYYINTKKKSINGQMAYATLADVPEDVDVAIVAIPARYVVDTIRASVVRCKNYIVISAGFGEMGVEGHNREMDLLALAQEKGLSILGPNCLGIIAPHLKLNASFAPGLPTPGRLAFISQSGALAVALVDRAKTLEIGMRHVVSIGNKMQITESELIMYFADDDVTDVIAIYIEGIRDGDAFLKSAAYARSRGKTIVILKSGRTDVAQKAIALHTGSLAGSDDVISQAFRQSGVIRAKTIDELFTLIRVALQDNTLIKRESALRVAIVTNAGGPGVLLTDAVGTTEHLVIGSLMRKESDRLKAKLPEAASVHNPIDLLGDADLTRYEDALSVCLASNMIDIIIVLLTPQEQTPAMEIATAIAQIQKDTKKLVVASFIGGASVQKSITYLHKHGVLHTESPERLVEAIERVMSARIVENEVIPKADYIRAQKTSVILEKAVGNALYLEDVAELASLYRIPMSPFWDVTEGLMTQKHITYPCVVKVDDPHILHKSDRGGVILPIQSGATLTKACATLHNRFTEETVRIVAQPLLPIKMELILGMKRDPLFGPVVIVGVGGIYTEIIKQRELFVGFLSYDTIIERLSSGVLAFLFTTTRGQDPYDCTIVAQIVVSLMYMAQENAIIKAVDINPLLLYNDKHTSVAVDMKVIVEL